MKHRSTLQKFHKFASFGNLEKRLEGLQGHDYKEIVIVDFCCSSKFLHVKERDTSLTLFLDDEP